MSNGVPVHAHRLVYPANPHIQRYCGSGNSRLSTA